MLPARYLPYVPTAVLVLYLACKLTTVFVRPPSPSSRWLPLYQLINKMALNLGWSVNAYQPGKAPILVPCDDASALRTEIAIRLDIDREATKP